MSRRPILLVHGGLAEDIDADRFWVRPGIVDALVGAGFEVLAPDRDTTPSSWSAAASAMAGLLDAASAVVAGSNGVSVAIRLAIDHPQLVDRLGLAWPATAGDARVDARVPEAARHLLAGETLRGVTDDELRRLRLPITIIPSLDDNPFHQRATVDRLATLLPEVTVAERGTPESPRPEFAPHLDVFVAEVIARL